VNTLFKRLIFCFSFLFFSFLFFLFFLLVKTENLKYKVCLSRETFTTLYKKAKYHEINVLITYYNRFGCCIFFTFVHMYIQFYNTLHYIKLFHLTIGLIPWFYILHFESLRVSIFFFLFCKIHLMFIIKRLIFRIRSKK
jgi:hypothetical protein